MDKNRGIINNKKRSEAALQFDDIWKKWNDPHERELRKILENRRKKIDAKKKDSGY